MTTWMARGLVFAAGMVFLRLVQGTLINASPTNAGTISLILIVLFGLAVSIWGLLDGIADARANPDPDRRRDLAMRWLVAGLVAGVLSGLVAWIISVLRPDLRGRSDPRGPRVRRLHRPVGVPAGHLRSGDRPHGRRPQAPHNPPAIMSAPTCSGGQRDDDYVHASRRESDWRQEYREAIREQHEDAERRIHDRD